ncbi:hypothetical protein [Streptomyces wuyuanensis]|uniref:hypothetical protein n=1 Tax=Streptomyces wuyuanensis TaxID=1196353 RepID=UPI00342EE351
MEANQIVEMPEVLKNWDRYTVDTFLHLSNLASPSGLDPDQQKHFYFFCQITLGKPNAPAEASQEQILDLLFEEFPGGEIDDAFQAYLRAFQADFLNSGLPSHSDLKEWDKHTVETFLYLRDLRSPAALNPEQLKHFYLYCQEVFGEPQANPFEENPTPTELLDLLLEAFPDVRIIQAFEGYLRAFRADLSFKEFTALRMPAVDSEVEFYTTLNLMEIELYKKSPGSFIKKRANDPLARHFKEFYTENFTNLAFSEHDRDLINPFEAYCNEFSRKVAQVPAKTPAAPVQAASENDRGGPVGTHPEAPTDTQNETIEVEANDDTDIPVSLRTLTWEKFFSPTRLEKLSRLPFDQLHIDTKNKKDLYHFLAYCHHRLRSSVDDASRREFIEALKDNPFTQGIDRPYPAYRDALENGTIATFHQDYLASFKKVLDEKIGQPGEDRPARSKVERLLQDSPVRTLSEGQMNLLVKMTADPTKATEYKNMSWYLKKMRQRISKNSTFGLICEFLNGKHETYLPKHLRKAGEPIHMSTIPYNRESVAELTNKERAHFNDFCMWRFRSQGESQENFAEYCRFIRGTASFVGYDKTVARVADDIVKHFTPKQFQDLASIANDFKTGGKFYGPVLELMEMFQQQELTPGEMRYAAVELGRRGPVSNV